MNLRCKRKAPSQLEGMLEMVSLKVSGLVHIRRTGGKEFQILKAEMLKLWAPNNVLCIYVYIYRYKPNS